MTNMKIKLVYLYLLNRMVTSRRISTL